MDFDLAWFVQTFGVAGLAGAAAYGGAWLAKGAIERAVAHAANIELEKLKAALVKDLEREREAFARELETTRKDAARDLERFKVELMQGAEERRLVLAKDLERERESFTRERSAT